MHHGRELARGPAFRLPAFGPGTIGVVHVPIPGFRQGQALRGLQTERVDVARKHQQAGKLLPALDDAEFGACLDRVDGVATRIRQTDHLGLGRLRLQQERGKVVGVERVAYLAEHLATVLLDRRCGIAFERMAEGIVGGEEEPGVAAGLHQRLAGAIGEHPGVISPVHGIGIALWPGEIGRRRAGDDEHLVLRRSDLADRQRHAGVGRVDDQIDLVDVIPLVGKLRTDIRLVLMVAANELDLDVGIGLGEVGNRQFGRSDRARSSDIGIKARHVGKHADLDSDLLGAGSAASQHDGKCRQADCSFH